MQVPLHLLALEREESLLARYSTDPTPALEAELLGRFNPLAHSFAARFRKNPDQDDDLRQVAVLALLKALRRYDPARGSRFAAFAAPTISGELKRYFRDHSWRLHIPRSVQENAMKVERSTSVLSESHGRSPTMIEVAEHAGISEEHVLEAIGARESQHSVSLDLPAFSDDPTSETLSDLVGSEESGYEQVEAQLSVESCVELTSAERAALNLRFVDGLSQHQIGKRIGVSQMQVSRILRAGLAKMLEAVQGDNEPDGRRTFAETRPDPRFPHGRFKMRTASVDVATETRSALDYPRGPLASGSEDGCSADEGG